MKNIITLAIGLLTCFSQAQIEDIITGLSSPGQMVLVGDELYFVEYSANNILKIDVTESSPIPELIYNTGDATMDIAIYENRLFYTHFAGDTVYELDLSDSSPTASIFATGLGDTDGLLLVGTELYVAERFISKISKFDITDPLPERQIVADVPNPRKLWLEGDLLIIGAQDGEQIMQIDITDTDPSPELIVNPGGITSGLIVHEGSIFVSYFFADKISSYNATDGLVVQINTGIDAPTGMKIIGEYLYFSQYNAGRVSRVALEDLPLVLGINDLEMPNLSILPNPTSEYFTIEGLTAPTNVTLYDIGGKLIRSVPVTPGQAIKINDLRPGVYFLSADGYRTQKLIKR